MNCKECIYYNSCCLWPQDELENGNHAGDCTYFNLIRPLAYWQDCISSRYKRCSNCGIFVDKDELFENHKWYQYCGCCGAKMEERKDYEQ